MFSIKSLQSCLLTHMKTLFDQSCFKQIQAGEDGGQDGEMGHKPDARFFRP